MDQKKTGELLKALRKEKGLTQEQLAELLGVSGRTVSRWETGSNMPDLDLLIQLADYYNVEIGEILNGERKSGSMNEETKKTALQIADYSSNEKEKLARRMCVLFIAGAVAFTAYLVMEGIGIADTFTDGMVAGGALGFAYGMMLVGILYTSGCLAKIRTIKMRLLRRR